MPKRSTTKKVARKKRSDDDERGSLDKLSELAKRVLAVPKTEAVEAEKKANRAKSRRRR